MYVCVCVRVCWRVSLFTWLLVCMCRTCCMCWLYRRYCMCCVYLWYSVVYVPYALYVLYVLCLLCLLCVSYVLYELFATYMLYALWCILCHGIVLCCMILYDLALRCILLCCVVPCCIVVYLIYRIVYTYALTHRTATHDTYNNISGLTSAGLSSGLLMVGPTRGVVNSCRPSFEGSRLIRWRRRSGAEERAHVVV